MRLKEKKLLQKFATTLKKFSAQGAKKVEYGSFFSLLHSLDQDNSQKHECVPQEFLYKRCLCLMKMADLCKNNSLIITTLLQLAKNGSMDISLCIIWSSFKFFISLVIVESNL